MCSPLAPNPLSANIMASAAQLPPLATVAGRRGCNYPPKRTMNDVRRPGKHEATVRDLFESAAWIRLGLSTILAPFFQNQTLNPNNVQLSHRPAVTVRERAVANVSADPPIRYKHPEAYKAPPGLGQRLTLSPAPTMPAPSRRFAPYPHSKPTPAGHTPRRQHPTSLFASTTNQLSWSGSSTTHTTGFEPHLAYPTYWETLPFELQTSWFAPGAQSGSPFSDDSAVTTPVSAVSQLPPQPLIRGVDYGVPGSGEHGLLFALPTFDIFQSNNGHMAGVPTSHPESITNMAQVKVPNDYQMQVGSLVDSYSLHHQTLTKADAEGVCSFAKTSPQFISPFSDSAVTCQPQLLPLYAPKPVRPIPKICFTPPEDDPLPPSSLLYQPVSKAVRETCFRAPPKPL